MSWASDLYRGKNDYDFTRLGRRMLVVSGVLLLISVGALLTRGLNLSIDFEGGSIWEIPSETFTEDEARGALGDFGPSAVERFQEATSTEGDRVVRVSGRVDSVEEGARAADELARAADLPEGEVTVSTVGPSWGQDITRQAQVSLVVFLVLVSLYISWRLEARMALAALIATLHDVLLTVGIYAVFQFEVTPATVISFLTILGFSLYDTIVVFDRLQENAVRIGRTGQYTYTAIVRRSLNQVFMRSVNTTVMTLIPVLSMLVVGQFVFGQPTLGDFSLALLIGLASGTYSSIFVAPPLTAMLKEREQRYRDIRARLVAKGVDVSDTSWHGLSQHGTGRAAAPATSRAAASAGGAATATAERTDGEGDGSAAPSRPVTTPGFGGHPPRPRKKRRR